MSNNGVLKPCPFCGNNAKPRRHTIGMFKRTTFHYVECVVCRVRTHVEYDIETAANVWNNRWNRRATDGNP
jgi:Lar family restriction alleviation protein